MEVGYEPVDADMRGLIEAVIAYAPIGLAPLRTQLATARTSNKPNGWIDVIDVAEGASIPWPAGPPGLDLFPAGTVPQHGWGPQNCYWVGLQFHSDGRLKAFEFYNDCDGPMDIAATTVWLDAIRPFPGMLAATEEALSTYRREHHSFSGSEGESETARTESGSIDPRWRR